MKWRYILAAFLLVALASPVVLYSISLDWGRAHTKRTEQLPVLTKTADDGEYIIPANGYRFRARVSGMRNSGPAIIALHGFPESSLMWRELADTAAKAGFRFVAFDQRGYSPGARPAGKSNYHLDALAADVKAVADVLGFDQFHLVGHDWGAGVAWKLAADRPGQVLSLSTLSIPHIGAFMDAVVNNSEQAARTSYFDFFRTPLVPEFWFALNSLEFFRTMLIKREAVERDEYLAILSEPGALTAALNWYRAMDESDLSSDPALANPIRMPTLFIWGNRDSIIVQSTIEAHRIKMPPTYTEIELNAGHGLIQEKPAEVVSAIMKNIRQVTPY